MLLCCWYALHSLIAVASEDIDMQCVNEVLQIFCERLDERKSRVAISIVSGQTFSSVSLVL